MNEETFNLSIRKYLKMVGINSQREIEQAVAKAVGDGRIATGSAADTDTLTAWAKTYVNALNNLTARKEKSDPGAIASGF